MLNPTNPWDIPCTPQFKGDITELEELRELKEDVGRREVAQATLIQSQVCRRTKCNLKTTCEHVKLKVRWGPLFS
jgi:hypothetical protein